MAKANAKKSGSKKTTKSSKAPRNVHTGPREKLGKAQLRILKALSQHKELTYRGISDKAKVGYNGLTSILSKESRNGKQFPTSLESRGLVKRSEYESKVEGEREEVHFTITAAGRKALETGVAGLGAPAGAPKKAVKGAKKKAAESKPEEAKAEVTAA